MHPAVKFNKSEYYVFYALIIIKFSIAVIVPSLLFPDSGVYKKYADAFIEQGFSMQIISLDSFQLFRTAGYPFVIVLAKTFFGTYHETVLNILQTSFSLLSFFYLFKIQKFLFSSRVISYIFILFYLSSRYTLYDISYLTDSLNASLFCLSLSFLFYHYLNLTVNHKRYIFFSGLFWALSILFRPASLYLSFIPLLIILASFLNNKYHIKTTLLLVFIFCIPVVSSYHLYCKWNQNRSGAYVLSTTGAVNWLWPMFNMKERNLHDSFQDDNLLSKEFKNNFSDYSFSAQMELFNGLKEKLKLNQIQIGQYLFGHLKHNIIQNPLAFIQNGFVNLYYTRMARLLFDPIRKVDQFLRFGLKTKGLHGFRSQWALASTQGGFKNISLALLYSITQIFAIIFFTLFILGVPGYGLYRLIKYKVLNQSLTISLFMWLCYCSMCFGYALIHFEMRMALPVLMFPLFGLIGLIQSVRQPNI
jgi:hypothetical protein